MQKTQEAELGVEPPLRLTTDDVPRTRFFSETDDGLMIRKVVLLTIAPVAQTFLFRCAALTQRWVLSQAFASRSAIAGSSILVICSLSLPELPTRAGLGKACAARRATVAECPKFSQTTRGTRRVNRIVLIYHGLAFFPPRIRRLSSVAKRDTLGRIGGLATHQIMAYLSSLRANGLGAGPS